MAALQRSEATRTEHVAASGWAIREIEEARARAAWHVETELAGYSEDRLVGLIAEKIDPDFGAASGGDLVSAAVLEKLVADSGPAVRRAALDRLLGGTSRAANLFVSELAQSQELFVRERCAEHLAGLARRSVWEPRPESAELTRSCATVTEMLEQVLMTLRQERPAVSDGVTAQVEALNALLRELRDENAAVYSIALVRARGVIDRQDAGHDESGWSIIERHARDDCTSSLVGSLSFDLTDIVCDTERAHSVRLAALDEFLETARHHVAYARSRGSELLSAPLHQAGALLAMLPPLLDQSCVEQVTRLVEDIERARLDPMTTDLERGDRPRVETFLPPVADLLDFSGERFWNHALHSFRAEVGRSPLVLSHDAVSLLCRLALCGEEYGAKIAERALEGVPASLRGFYPQFAEMDAVRELYTGPHAEFALPRLFERGGESRLCELREAYDSLRGALFETAARGELLHLMLRLDRDAQPGGSDPRCIENTVVVDTAAAAARDRDPGLSGSACRTLQAFTEYLAEQVSNYPDAPPSYVEYLCEAARGDPRARPDAVTALGVVRGDPRAAAALEAVFTGRGSDPEVASAVLAALCRAADRDLFVTAVALAGGFSDEQRAELGASLSFDDYVMPDAADRALVDALVTGLTAPWPGAELRASAASALARLTDECSRDAILGLFAAADADTRRRLVPVLLARQSEPGVGEALLAHAPESNEVRAVLDGKLLVPLSVRGSPSALMELACGERGPLARRAVGLLAELDGAEAVDALRAVYSREGIAAEVRLEAVRALAALGEYPRAFEYVRSLAARAGTPPEELAEIGGALRVPAPYQITTPAEMLETIALTAHVSDRATAAHMIDMLAVPHRVTPSGHAEFTGSEPTERYAEALEELAGRLRTSRSPAGEEGDPWTSAALRKTESMMRILGRAGESAVRQGLLRSPEPGDAADPIEALARGYKRSTAPDERIAWLELAAVCGEITECTASARELLVTAGYDESPTVRERSALLRDKLSARSVT